MEKRITFTINTYFCRHELPLIKELIQYYQWEEINTKERKGDLQWLIPTKKEENLERIQSVKAIYNRLPGLQLVSNKLTLSMIFHRLSKHYETDFNFSPLTFSLPSDSEALQEYMSRQKGTYIAKPQGGAEGNGIFLLKSFKELPSYTFQQGYIVQSYLDNPLLVNNKKFDLRIYVMVTSLDPLVALIAEEGLVRFCTEDYQQPNSTNLKDTLMHLTNYSLNKYSDKYVKCENLLEQNQATKRTLTSLMKLLQVDKIDTEYLFEQIKDTCTKALIAIQPFVLREQERQVKKLKGECFQILGFDIFIDSKLKAWLLEINDHPSLNINLDSDKNSIELSPIDRYVKMKVLGEAIQLMRQDSIIDKARYEGWIRLLPNKEFDEYDSFYQAKAIYDKLVGKKGSQMTCLKFTKLSNIKGLPSDKLLKPHYEILYKRILSKHKTQQMTLEVFFSALESLADSLYPYEIDRVDVLISAIIKELKK